MLTLETLLTATEREQFNALVKETTHSAGQAVRLHSHASGVLVVGICAGGELLTWFATPAHSAAEADVAQSVILSGIAQASATVAALQTGASDIAASAIAKAGMH
jgi:predicted metal-dependent enzyme (double-stranded beta helix superfamily)